MQGWEGGVDQFLLLAPELWVPKDEKSALETQLPLSSLARRFPLLFLASDARWRATPYGVARLRAPSFP